MNVIPEVSPRSRAMHNRRKLPPVLSSYGVVMMGAVPLQTRTLVLDYPMGFSMQMILGLVEMS